MDFGSAYYTTNRPDAGSVTGSKMGDAALLRLTVAIHRQAQEPRVEVLRRRLNLLA